MSAKQIPAIEFRHVYKRYRLYRSDKHRFLGIFSKRIAFKEVFANRDLTFKSSAASRWRSWARTARASRRCSR